MYGLVNRALQGLVTDIAGRESWLRISEAAASPQSFISMETYPDSISLSLVGAAAEELDITPGEFLTRLGRYWVTHTGQEGYGRMFDLWGADLRTFLINLDEMHERVKLTMPHLEPPSFSVQDEDARTMRLSYRSDRDGMAPMVIGILEGLASKFSTEVSIQHVVFRPEAGHDEFLVTLRDD